jgi:hypothetical protein
LKKRNSSKQVHRKAYGEGPDVNKLRVNGVTFGPKDEFVDKEKDVIYKLNVDSVKIKKVGRPRKQKTLNKFKKTLNKLKQTKKLP